jgi:hypothetical protein
VPLVRYKPCMSEEVVFDFPLRTTRNRVAREVEHLQLLRLAGKKVSGVRAMRRLDKWLQEIALSGSPVENVPLECVAKGLFTSLVVRRCFCTGYCPACEKTYQRANIKRMTWKVQGRRVNGYGYGGASGSFLGCPQGHVLFQLHKRIS